MSGVDLSSLERLVYEGWQKYHAGDKDALSDIYGGLMPFCLRVCSRTCGTYISDSDEEASIARVSIIEAFDHYEPEKGPLLFYLGRVIRNRLIDYKRSEKSKNIIFWADFSENHYTAEDHVLEDLVEEMARRHQIQEFIALLGSYGISVAELTRSSPRQTRTREKAKMICCKIAADSQMRNYLLDKKMLPAKLLEERGFFKRKILDRYRRYIIAGALILIYDFNYLKPYVWPNKGGTDVVR